MDRHGARSLLVVVFWCIYIWFRLNDISPLWQTKCITKFLVVNGIHWMPIGSSLNPRDTERRWHSNEQTHNFVYVTQFCRWNSNWLGRWFRMMDKEMYSCIKSQECTNEIHGCTFVIIIGLCHLIYICQWKIWFCCESWDEKMILYLLIVEETKKLSNWISMRWKAVDERNTRRRICSTKIR